MTSWSKRHFFSILLLVLVLQQCITKQEVPNEIIQPEQMAHLITQIHLIEAIVSELGIRKDSSQKIYTYLEQQMLEEEGIDTVLFAKSFDYYTQNPEIFSKVYETAVDSLSEMEERKKRIEDEKRKKKKANRDSIRKVHEHHKFHDLKKGDTLLNSDHSKQVPKAHIKDKN